MVATAAPCTTWARRVCAVVGQQQGEHDAAADHAHQQHHVHQRHHARARVFRRQVGGEREAGGLHRLRARAHEQEGHRRSGAADPHLQRGFAGQQDERERHDRQPAELQPGAAPDVGHAAPAEKTAVQVGAQADHRAQRRDRQRQRHHQGHQPGEDAELDDHHAVERAHREHGDHAHAHLEQRKAQQPRQRQVGARRIGERQVARGHLLPVEAQPVLPRQGDHRAGPSAVVTSRAWEV